MLRTMRYSNRHCAVSALICALLGSVTSVSAQLPAFPGAEGFGSTTPGGRGGQVFIVTNLNNSGPGSFREACEAAVPRVVVFAVGGEILLSRAIIVLNPYITIAGQTAPGGGITIRNDGTSEEDTLIFQNLDMCFVKQCFRGRKPNKHYVPENRKREKS